MRLYLILAFSTFLLVFMSHFNFYQGGSRNFYGMPAMSQTPPSQAQLQSFVSRLDRRPINFFKVVKNYAIIAVSDAYTGGTYLYKWNGKNWELVVATGGGLNANDLMIFNVPSNIASDLVRR